MRQFRSLLRVRQMVWRTSTGNRFEVRVPRCPSSTKQCSRLRRAPGFVGGGQTRLQRRQLLLFHQPARRDVTNETLIEDLRLVPIPQWWQNPWAWLLIALVVGAGVYIFRRWLKSRPLPLKLPKSPPPGPPAHLDALHRLELLRLRHAKLSAHDVAVECSDILRRYIEARFGLPIRYQTTREFLGAARQNPELSPESREELGVFLGFFDGLKFAQVSASAEQTGAAIDGAERFVRKCIPVENVPAT